MDKSERLHSKESIETRDEFDEVERSDSKRVRQENRAEVTTPSTKRSWLRMPRWRSDPRLGEDYSDVSSERRKRDEGFDEPYSKKRGWFSKKPSSDREEQGSDRAKEMERKPIVTSHRHRDDERDDSIPDFKEVSPPRRSWWKRAPKGDLPDKGQSRSSSSEHGDSVQSKRRWFQKSSKKSTEKGPASDQPKVKKSWGLLKKRTSTAEQSNIPIPDVSKQSSDKPKRKLFAFLDSLKLKPPAEGKAKSAPIPVNSSRTQAPSSSAAQRNDTTKSDNHYSETRHAAANDEDDFEDDGSRSLSKAERKRLRRQQQENRRAA